jgi:threonine dehydratase
LKKKIKIFGKTNFDILNFSNKQLIIMFISLQEIEQAAKRLEGISKKTPLEKNDRLSKKYEAEIYFKREDLQTVRSFKIRGAYNLIKSLEGEQKNKGVVCASAGNHAQGVAFSCSNLKVKGVIFMPVVTPNQKINKVKDFGGGWVEIQLVGDNYDQASQAAKAFCNENNMVYVHPYNDPKTIAGQGTIAMEIDQELEADIMVVAIGGGGLISGIGSYFKQIKPGVEIIGVEPTGAASMYQSFKAGKVTEAPYLDTFCDGVAVKKTEDFVFSVAKEVIDEIHLIEEGHVATDMINLYQNEGIITEPAGALAVSALEKIKNKIKNKKVVCIICGGNNDISRYPEVIERSLVWQGLKHYFLIEFSQKPGQLRKFLETVLGPDDDITRFEYVKKTNKEKGAALVGIELKNKNDYELLIEKFKTSGIEFKIIKTDDLIYEILV